MHKPREGGSKCEGGLARGLVGAYQAEDGEDPELEMDLRKTGRQEGREKFVHGIRNGEIVEGPANERRMRHAIREGNRPSFWTYLKVNGCRGCQKQEKDETIHHVLGGGCEALGKIVIIDIWGRDEEGIRKV
eukprot:6211777-Pleurochrysis_carterae.AAC.8